MIHKVFTNDKSTCLPSVCTSPTKAPFLPRVVAEARLITWPQLSLLKGCRTLLTTTHNQTPLF